MNYHQKMAHFQDAYKHPGCSCCATIVELINYELIENYKRSLEPSRRLAGHCRWVNKFSDHVDEEPIIHPTMGQPFFEYLYNDLYI